MRVNVFPALDQAFSFVMILNKPPSFPTLYPRLFILTEPDSYISQLRNWFACTAPLVSKLLDFSCRQNTAVALFLCNWMGHNKPFFYFCFPYFITETPFILHVNFYVCFKWYCKTEKNICSCEGIFRIMGFSLGSLRKDCVVVYVGLDKEVGFLVIIKEILTLNGSGVGLVRYKTDSVDQSILNPPSALWHTD